MRLFGLIQQGRSLSPDLRQEGASGSLMALTIGLEVDLWAIV